MNASAGMMGRARSHVGIPRVSTVVVVINLIVDPAVAKDYPSPDATMTVTVSEQGGRDCEAQILFKDRSHEILRQSYVSADHNQGNCVAMAKWTPDSRYFVFSLASSGGHQPWHAPILFFSRQTARIGSLEDYVSDPITDPTFSVSPPDIVEFTTIELPLDGKSPRCRSIHLSALGKGKR
jgi:hypothetical protein